ncbi:YceI family protein [Herbiconiux sp. VKM Ac-2851]|uniref:YceI family protein n=1 Tax=Herbiconiux sp. VKM Ac-2851 TaxID=2739025 RepID=UPI0015636786|nr:YceI family protein [Herbiconiux sp. VKM Ac-2851]
MNRSAKTAVALMASVAAIGAVALVAVPILARSMTLDQSATVQAVMPTVFGTPDDQLDGADESTSFSIDRSSSIGYRMESSSGDDLVSAETDEISGVIARTGDTITTAEFMVDLATLAGDGGPRNAVLSALLAATGGNSTASFVLSDPVALPEAGGDPVETTITGTLTVRGISHEVQAQAEIGFDGESGTLTGSIPIALSDYGFSSTALAVVGASDTAHIDIDLVAAPAN